MYRPVGSFSIASPTSASDFETTLKSIAKVKNWERERERERLFLMTHQHFNFPSLSRWFSHFAPPFQLSDLAHPISPPSPPRSSSSWPRQSSSRDLVHWSYCTFSSRQRLARARPKCRRWSGTSAPRAPGSSSSSGGVLHWTSRHIPAME